MLKKILLPLITLALTGCGTPWTVTKPERSALEQILLSTASERALSNITPAGNNVKSHWSKLGKTFVDARNFDSYDEQYALHAVKDYFLNNGVALVSDIKAADTILEVAAGALSIDNTESFFGIPKLGMPIPLAGQLSLPEIPLYKKETNRALAKLAISFRDAKTGKIKDKSIVSMGTSEVTKWHVFLLFSFIDNDLKMPKDYKAVEF